MEEVWFLISNLQIMKENIQGTDLLSCCFDVDPCCLAWLLIKSQLVMAGSVCVGGGHPAFFSRPNCPYM